VGRRASEVLSLLDLPDVKVIFADSPNAGQLQIGILAVVAQEEALAISTPIRAALTAAKARGAKLGNPNGADALQRYQAALRAAGKTGNEAGLKAAKESADHFARNVWSEVVPLVAARLTDAVIAERLNEAGIPTRRNGKWHETSIRRVRARMES
jgi:DNA invertase Pin-like site-specific DNA recombinase